MPRIANSINKHPKFDDNFDIRRQSKHFEYEMNQTVAIFQDGKSKLFKILEHVNSGPIHLITINHNEK